MFFTVWFLMHFSAGANPAEGGAKPQAKPAESAKPEPAPPAQPTEPVSSAEPAQPQAQSAEPAPPAQPTEPVSSAEPAKSQAPSAEGTAPPTEQAQPSVQKKPQDPQVDLPKIPEQIQKAASNPDHSINKARTSIKNVNQKFVEVKELMRNYSYESENRRNPFKPPASVGKDLEEDLIPSYPTGQYDLSSIKLIGIKWGSGEKGFPAGLCLKRRIISYTPFKKMTALAEIEPSFISLEKMKW